MTSRSVTQRLLFPNAFRKPVVAQFDQERASSDGGAVLLKAADQRMGVTKALAGALRDGLDIGRTSCTRFWANQFRVLLTQAAYVLLQELRLQLRGTALARAQVATMRDHLLKLGVQVSVSVRRIVLHLPRSYPHQPRTSQRVPRGLTNASQGRRHE